MGLVQELQEAVQKSMTTDAARNGQSRTIVTSRTEGHDEKRTLSFWVAASPCAGRNGYRHASVLRLVSGTSGTHRAIHVRQDALPIV